MKKRIISLLLASAMLLSMTSCSKKEGKSAYYEGMPLTEYLDKVGLRKNMTASFDPEAVFDGETVYVYENVTCIDVEDDLLVEQLLHSSVIEEQIDAFGIGYIAETDSEKEQLRAYDGGEAFFGTRGEGAVDGGFNYYRNKKTEKSNVSQYLPTIYPEVCYVNGIPEHLKGFYQSAEKNLDFAARDEIAQNAISLFETLHLPEIEVHEIVAYDLDALKAIDADNEKSYAVLYQYMFENYPDAAEELSGMYETDYDRPSKNDETYMVFGRQLIDGIPIANYGVKQTVDCAVGGAEIHLQYKAEGLVMAEANGLIEPPEQSDGTESKILSASAVLERVQESYGDAVLLEPYTIESLDLVYKTFYNSDGSMDLKPCWLARVSYPFPVSVEDWDGQVIEGEVKGYDHLYFDAVTGTYLDESVSAKRDN